MIYFVIAFHLLKILNKQNVVNIIGYMNLVCM